MTNDKGKDKASLLILRTDGAARGNPGPAGIGCVLEDGNGVLLEEFSEYIGETTNNLAEYTAVLYGLKEARDYNGREIQIISDSELVVRQLKGEYKVKNDNLKQAYNAALYELASYKRASFHHVQRQENIVADELANRAIDDYAAGLKTEILRPESLWSQEPLF